MPASPSRKRNHALRVVSPAAPAGPPVAGSTERIVQAITGAIVERRLMPGTRLVEQKIADIFGVSRTLVRQALNQLSRDRLVTITPARGAVVATPGVEEAQQVFQTRAMLEAALVRQLCESVTDEQLRPLQAHLKDEAQAVRRGDVALRTRLLADFHIVLARLSGNQVLVEILQDLLARSQLVALMMQSQQSAEDSHREHEQVAEAIARRDARAAIRLMNHHLESVERSLRQDARGFDLEDALRPASRSNGDLTP